MYHCRQQAPSQRPRRGGKLWRRVTCEIGEGWGGGGGVEGGGQPFRGCRKKRDTICVALTNQPSTSGPPPSSLLDIIYEGTEKMRSERGARPALLSGCPLVESVCLSSAARMM